MTLLKCGGSVGFLAVGSLASCPGSNKPSPLPALPLQPCQPTPVPTPCACLPVSSKPALCWSTLACAFCRTVAALAEALSGPCLEKHRS
jgi:hypothetical protein